MKPQMKTIKQLIDKAEEKIWYRSEEVMLTLYWDVGFQLRGIEKEKIAQLSKKLSEKLGVEPRIFEVAYHFYKDNPIKKKALMVVAQ
jgi:hypothetical protein